MTRERVELAAYVGHVGAASALGRANPCPHDGVTGCSACDMRRMTGGLHRFGSLAPAAPLRTAEILVRAAVGAARAALVVWENLPTTICYDEDLEPVGTYPRRAVQACEAWLVDPTDRRIDALRAVVSHARRGGRFLPTWALLDSMFTPARNKVSRAGFEAIVLFASGQAGEAPVREAIQSALIAWALGEHRA